MDSLNGGDGAESLGRPRQVKFTGQSAREERTAHGEKPETAENHLQIVHRVFISMNMGGGGGE